MLRNREKDIAIKKIKWSFNNSSLIFKKERKAIPLPPQRG
jgi:hypothetical protein